MPLLSVISSDYLISMLFQILSEISSAFHSLTTLPTFPFTQLLYIHFANLQLTGRGSPVLQLS